MKLSSISLIAASLAAIASSVTATPSPGPFERDIDIYSRAHPDEHEAAAKIHMEAVGISQVVANRAKKIGWDRLDAFHTSAAERNFGHAWRHTLARSLVNGTAYDLSSLDDATHTIETAHKNLAKVEHTEAAMLNHVASQYAHNMGLQDRANWHHKAAKLHDAYARSDIQDPEFVKATKAQAHEIISLHGAHH